MIFFFRFLLLIPNNSVKKNPGRGIDRSSDSVFHVSRQHESCQAAAAAVVVAVVVVAVVVVAVVVVASPRLTCCGLEGPNTSGTCPDDGTIFNTVG